MNKTSNIYSPIKSAKKRRTSLSSSAITSIVNDEDNSKIFEPLQFSSKGKADIEQNPYFTTEFLNEIPKCELHSHLDGGVRIKTLIELAKNNENITLPYDTEDDLKKYIFKDSYQSLEEYLQPFGIVVPCLNNTLSLKRVAYEYAIDSIMDGVRYFEVRFAPQLHASNTLSISNILIAVNEGCKQACDEYNKNLNDNEPKYDYGIIVCALRMFVKNILLNFDNYIFKYIQIIFCIVEQCNIFII